MYMWHLVTLSCTPLPTPCANWTKMSINIFVDPLSLPHVSFGYTFVTLKVSRIIWMAPLLRNSLALIASPIVVITQVQFRVLSIWTSNFSSNTKRYSRGCRACDSALQELETIDDDAEKFNVEFVKINDKRCHFDTAAVSKTLDHLMLSVSRI